MQWIQLMILTSMAGGFFSSNITVLLKALQKERESTSIQQQWSFDKKKLWQEDFLPRPNKRDNSFHIYFADESQTFPRGWKTVYKNSYGFLPSRFGNDSMHVWCLLQWRLSPGYSRVSEESFLFSLSFFLSSLSC